MPRRGGVRVPPLLPEELLLGADGRGVFIFLDSGEYNDIFNRTDPDASYNDGAEAYFAEQRRWLEETVRREACRTAKFRVVLVHAPPCSLGAYEKRNFKPLVDGLLCTWDPKKPPEVKTHLWISGHKHETWIRESLGINQVGLDGPQKIGCAALEVGSDALRLRIYQAAADRLWDEITVTPGGAHGRVSGTCGIRRRGPSTRRAGLTCWALTRSTRSRRCRRGRCCGSVRGATASTPSTIPRLTT